MKIVELPRDTGPVNLAEGFLELAKAGQVKWALMVICEPTDLLRFEWTRLPSNLTAIGAVECLKQQVMDQ